MDMEHVLDGQIKSEIEIKVEPLEICDIQGAPMPVKSENEEAAELEVTVKQEPETQDDIEQQTWCPAESITLPHHFVNTYNPLAMKSETDDHEHDSNNIWMTSFQETPTTSEEPARDTENSTSKSKSKKVKKKKKPETPSHGDSEIHRCLLCPLEFRQELNLQQHVAWVHFGDRFHSCPHCGRRFFELAKLSRHMASTHKTDTPVTCVVCKQKFNGKYLLDCHMILEHPPSKSSRTISRNKNDKSKLIVEDKIIDRSRVEVIEGPISKKLKSNTATASSVEFVNCNIDFKSHPSGSSGKVNKISGDKLVNNVAINSVTCSKEVVSDEESEIQKEVHSCPECDKPFTNKDALESHWKIHESVKPLECSKCWKWFLQPEELQKHLSVVHSL